MRTEVRHLTEEGVSVNFLGEKSGFLDRAPSQWIALGVVLAVTAVALSVGAAAADRRGRGDS